MTQPTFGDRRLLIDNSAYARLGVRQVQRDFVAATGLDLLYVHPAFMHEQLYSARNGQAFTALREQLDELPFAPYDELTHELVLRSQEELAAVSSAFQRRFSMQDLLCACAAHQHGVGVWHYDRDFDDILQHTSLTFDSVWAAPQGALGPATTRTPRRALKTSLNNALARLPDDLATGVMERLLADVEQTLRDAGEDVPARLTAE